MHHQRSPSRQMKTIRYSQINTSTVCGLILDWTCRNDATSDIVLSLVILGSDPMLKPLGKVKKNKMGDKSTVGKQYIAFKYIHSFKIVSKVLPYVLAHGRPNRKK